MSPGQRGTPGGMSTPLGEVGNTPHLEGQEVWCLASLAVAPVFFFF